MRILIYLTLITGFSPIYFMVPALEHFPYGLLCVLFIHRANPRAYLLIFLMISVYLLFYLGYLYSDDEVSIKYLVLGLNAVSPLFFMRGNEEKFSKAAEHIFWLYLIVGGLQMLHLLVPFEEIIRLFIARFHGSPLGAYRGVQMLETEPARASFQILMLYILATTFNEKNRLKLLSLLVVAQIIMIGSTSGIIITAIYFAFKYSFLIFRSPKYIAILLIGIGAVFYYGDGNPKIKLIKDQYKAESFAGVFTALAASSGGRFLGTTTSLEKIWENPIGHGPSPEFFGKERIEISNYEIEGYSTRVSSRPVSAILTFIYVYGVWMLVPLIWAMAYKQRIFRLNSEGWFIVSMSVFYSPPGTEIVLITLLAIIAKPNIILRKQALYSFQMNYFDNVSISGQRQYISSRL